MPSTVEILENKKVKLTITVDKEEFGQAMHRAYLKVRKQITLPGFRKGKAPRPIIQNYYGEEVFYEDAIDDTVKTTYVKALEENNVQDVDRPDIDIVEIGSGKDLIYTAEVTVKPEVTLGKYKGEKVSIDVEMVTDDDVQKDVDKAADQISRWVEVEGRAAQDADKVTIDYKGMKDGVAFSGGTAEGHELELGSNTFIPGFEAQVIGMSVDEEKSINLTFSQDYQNEELQGQDVVFEVKLNKITVKELPEIDDEFAKDISEFDTLDEYKADLRAKLEKAVDDKKESDSQKAVMELVVSGAEVDIPQCMIDSQIDYMLRELEYRFSGQGFSLEQYMQMTGMNTDKLKEQYMGEAENRVKAQLVLEAVRKTKDITITDEDFENELVRMSEENDRDIEELKKTFIGQNKQYMKDSLLENKTMDFLKETIDVKITKS